MDYILTMEDGSSAYLSHHGVKGMKWGVRNEETLAKYLGGARSKRTKKLHDKAEKNSQEWKDWNGTIKLVKKPGSPSKSYSSAKDRRKAYRFLDKQTKLEKKLYESDARDAGLKPDKNRSKNIGLGIDRAKYGLKDNERRAAKQLTQLQKESSVKSKVSDKQASEAASIISTFNEKQAQGKVTMSDYIKLAKALKRIEKD